MRTTSSFRFAAACIALTAAAAVCLPLMPAEARGEGRPGDIVDTAVSAGNFETLVAAVKAAGLVDTLKSRGPFTVFAPTDEAFSQLPAGTLKSLLEPEQRDQLQAILTYHVVPGKVLARQAFGLDNAETVNGQRLDVSRKDGKLAIDGANVVAADIQTSNGVIHVIDRVLLPNQERIPGVAQQAGQFKTLLAAVGAAGLADVLGSDGPFTVFAPTDDAFKKLPKGTVKKLLKPENKQKLVDILKYHVASGRVYSEQAAKASQAATLLGPAVETSVAAEGLKINDALVVQADIQTANGVIHVIDSVLLPQQMDAKQAMKMIQDAIRRGVPVFNHGDHRGCAEMYMTACQTIVDSNSDEVPHSVMQTLKTTVDRAKRIHHSGSRAWALRHGMDSALSGLRRMSLTSVDSGSR